jgi:hypothetical protein
MPSLAHGEPRSRVTSDDQSTRYPVVYASLSDPCPGRDRDHVLTSTCPYCGGRHHHRSAGLRRAGCRRGQYVVLVARRYRRQVKDAA